MQGLQVGPGQGRRLGDAQQAVPYDTGDGNVHQPAPPGKCRRLQGNRPGRAGAGGRLPGLPPSPSAVSGAAWPWAAPMLRPMPRSAAAVTGPAGVGKPANSWAFTTAPLRLAHTG